MNGFVAWRPVKTPSFSTFPSSRARRSWRAEPRDLRLALRGVGEPRKERVDHRVLRREHHERRAPDRVDARREDPDRVAALDREVDLGAVRLPHPVALLLQHALGPGRELRHVVEESVLVGGDAEEPLLHVPLLDRVAAAPAVAALGLLVREHGEAGRAPVDRGLRAIGDPLLEHAQEEPLVPAVVRGVAGRDLAAPRVAEAEPLQLPLHRGDVVARPFLGMHPALDRRVLGRQPERVPPDRVHHVHPAHRLAARDHVGDAVVAHVPHVDVARRIGQHLQAVELGPLGVLGDLEHPVRRPLRLPARLDVQEVVIRHRSRKLETSQLSTQAHRPPRGAWGDEVPPDQGRRQQPRCRSSPSRSH